jgi:hypothetical protein
MSRYFLTARTAERIKQLLADGGKVGARATTGSAARGLTWCKVTGAESGGWYPAVVSLDQAGEFEDLTAVVHVAAAGELAEGERYPCTRTGDDPADGTARFRVTASADVGPDPGGATAVGPGWIYGLPFDRCLTLTVLGAVGACAGVDSDQAVTLEGDGVDSWNSTTNFAYGGGTGAVELTRSAGMPHLTIGAVELGYDGAGVDGAGNHYLDFVAPAALCDGDEGDGCDLSYFRVRVTCTACPVEPGPDCDTATTPAFGTANAYDLGFFQDGWLKIPVSIGTVYYVSVTASSPDEPLVTVSEGPDCEDRDDYPFWLAPDCVEYTSAVNGFAYVHIGGNLGTVRQGTVTIGLGACPT